LAHGVPLSTAVSSIERGAHATAAFRHRAFRHFLGARFLVVVGGQMQSVAIGWQVYALTHDPLKLGWVGLAQFLPMMLLALPSGHVADRYDRKRILVACFSVATLASGGLAVLAATRPSLPLLYALLALIGTSRAFHGPAISSLLPNLVPRDVFPNAVAWSSTVWQVATVGGPALGGLVYGAFGPTAVYAGTAGTSLLAVVLVSRIVLATRERAAAAPGTEALVAGLRFVWRNKVILGAISLDLFAVLLGGAVALLPALAHDVLHTGPSSLGVLRGAPAFGAALMAIHLARRPLRRRAGWTMLVAVAVFGAATVVLGLSRSFGLSVAALVLLGASDMISVFVRQNLVQLGTPDEMRGRVSAVNLVFIGASNELGEFESGVTAAWLGVVPAVIAGGVGTLLVVAVFALIFPALRRVDALT
jgi:MFS family permease